MEPQMLKIKPLSAAIALSLYGATALAQQAMLEEVIVTATKRTESLQDIAVTVTAFSEDTIQDANIRDASDVAVLTPSLNINANISPFSTRVSIRGIGTAGSTFLEPSVGTFVDGVYLNRSGLAVSDLVDIERIEVLQGPQGTLYGKNTNAGAISITTKTPNFEETEGHLEVTAGNYSTQRATGSVSGPIADSLAYRVAGNYHQRDGYLENLSGPDLNDADEWNVVGKLQWEPTNDLSMLLKASTVRRDMNCCSPDGVQSPIAEQALIDRGDVPLGDDPFDHKTAQTTPSPFEQESTAVSLHIDYDTNWGAIESITAWDDYELESSQQASRSALDVVWLNQPQSGDSFSQELRFSGETDNIDYMAGLYYFEQETREFKDKLSALIGDDLGVGAQIFGPTLTLIAAPGDFGIQDSVFETQTIAVFSRATWHISDNWHLTGGVRWSDEEKDADLFVDVESTALTAQDPENIPPALLALLAQQGITPPFSLLAATRPEIDQSFNRSSDNVDWLASVSYDLNIDTLLFASASTGTKSGGFNGVAGEPEDREFDDEDTTSYELGIKTTLLDSRLRINSTLFLTQIEKLQSSQQAASGLGQFTSNQGEAEVAGLDFQMDALPLPNLTVTLGLQYLDTYEFTEGPDKGLDLAFAAELSGSLAATLVLPLADGGIYLRGDYSFMGDHTTNTATAAVLEAKDEQDRENLNMTLGWRNDNWNVSVWGKNLTDEAYAAQTLTPFPITDMDAYFLAPPRTYGATLRYNF
jgi:iron complex outermembrane recepter protein